MNSSTNKTISLSRRLTLHFVLVLTIMVALIGGFYCYFTISHLEENYTEKVEGTLKFLSGSLAPILWTLDKPTIDKVAHVALENELISDLTIRDHKDRTLFSTTAPEKGINPIKSKDIYYKGEIVGKLEVTFSRSSLTENLKNIFWLVFLLWLIAIFTITLFTKIFIRRFFRGPIEAFTNLAEAYRQQPRLSPLKSTPFLEFQPIENVVINLTNEVFMQMQELHENKERLELALKFANDGLFDWNLTTNQIYYSPAWKRLLGYEDNEIKNEFSEWERLTRPEDVKKSWGILNEVIEGTRSRFVAEFKMRHKQGGWVDILSRANVIFNEKGEGVRVVGTHTDITKRKQAEQKLKESEKRFRTLFETAPTIILHLSPDGEILNLNPEAVRFFGYDHTEIIGQNCITTFLPKKAHEPVLKEIKKVLKGRIARGFENTVINADGAERLMTWDAALFEDDYSKSHGIICMGRDITEQRKIEFQLQHAQKMEAIGTLAGGIAHDFNNMLGVILGNASFAISCLDDHHELYAVLSDIKKGAEQAQNLTQQLLTFSKGGAPVKKTADLTQLIKESSKFIIRGTNSKCHYSLSEDLLPVEADKGQLNQVINNLVINANQAMPRGGIIRIRAENIELDAGSIIPLPAGSYVMISIEDQGIGIPEKHLAMIFDPFFTTKQKKSGLGLATSYSIIKQHGGHINVRSKPDMGSVFNIFLPASFNELEKKAANQKKNLHKDRRKILVMDDQEAILDMVGRMINRIGHECVFATDGSEAIHKYREAYESDAPFDLVILDLTVPGGMGGAETISELLKIDPDVKAVVSSGYSNDPIMADFKDYGFCGVIPKPYSKGELTELLNEF